MDYRADIERALEVAPVLDEAPLRALVIPGSEIMVPTIEDLAELQKQVLEFDVFRNIDLDFMIGERGHEGQHAEANSIMGFESVFKLCFNWINQEDQTDKQIFFQHLCQPLGKLTVAQHAAGSIYPEVPSPGDAAVVHGNLERAARRIQQNNTFDDPLPLPLWYKPAFRKLFF